MRPELELEHELAGVREEAETRRRNPCAGGSADQGRGVGERQPALPPWQLDPHVQWIDGPNYEED